MCSVESAESKKKPILDFLFCLSQLVILLNLSTKSETSYFLYLSTHFVRSLAVLTQLYLQRETKHQYKSVSEFLAVARHQNGKCCCVLNSFPSFKMVIYSCSFFLPAINDNCLFYNWRSWTMISCNILWTIVETSDTAIYWDFNFLLSFTLIAINNNQPIVFRRHLVCK